MKVYPIFNLALLCKYEGKYRPPGPIIIDKKAEYEVEKIFRHRENSKRHQYLVRWLGYNESEDYWMKAEELTNLPLVL